MCILTLVVVGLGLFEGEVPFYIHRDLVYHGGDKFHFCFVSVLFDQIVNDTDLSRDGFLSTLQVLEDNSG